MSTLTLTPKQRKRSLKRENRALRPMKVAAVKPAAIPDPWGTGKAIPTKPPSAPRPATECLHVLAVHYLEREERNRRSLYTSYVYCYEGGKHSEHSGSRRSWS